MTPLLRGTVLALSLMSAIACRDYDSTPGDGLVDQASTPTGVEAPIAATDSGAAWSPPYLLHFVGYTHDNLVHHVNASPDAVYWMTDRYKVWRGGLEVGSTSGQVYDCYNCLLEVAVDGEQLFLLRQNALIQVDAATGADTITETPISHAGAGVVAVDTAFAYSVPMGCGGVGRYARPNLTAEVALTSAPRTTTGGGINLRVRTDGGLLVSCPNSITVFDSWGATPRNVSDPIDGLASSDASELWIYWIERHREGDSAVGVVPWQSDKGAQMYPLPAPGGDYRDACVLPGTELFLIPRMKALDVFDGETRSFNEPIQLEGRPHSVYCAQDAVYVALEGTRQHEGIQGEDTIASWIAKIPREVLKP